MTKRFQQVLFQEKTCIDVHNSEEINNSEWFFLQNWMFSYDQSKALLYLSAK